MYHIQANLLKLSYTWGGAFYDKENLHNDTKVVWIIIWKVSFLSLSSLIIYFVIYWSIVWLGRSIHSRMFFRLTHARVTEFLQRTSNGIIMNRFSNDVNNIDNFYAYVLSYILYTMSGLIVSFIQIMQTLDSYVALIPCAAFVLFGYIQRNRYMTANREMVRLMAISKSPVVGMSTSSISGSPIIRTMKIQGHFRTRIDHRIHENVKNNLMSIGLLYWFNFAMSFLNNFCILLPLNAILVYQAYSVERNASMSSLASFISFVQSFSSFYQTTLGQASVIESFLVSVERCMSYESLEPEKGYKQIKQQKRMFESLNKRKAKKGRKYIENRSKK